MDYINIRKNQKLREASVIDKMAIREFDEIYPPPRKSSAADIKRL